MKAGEIMIVPAGVEVVPIKHYLKILPEYFEAIISGVKKFELRKDDRDYQIGDTVIFREYDGKDFTGRYTQQVRIEYILRDCPEYGLMDGYCIFGFRG